MASVYRWTKESVSEALRLFYKAIEVDPDFATAYGMAAWCYFWRIVNGWTIDRVQEVAEATRLAGRAAELGKDDAIALADSAHPAETPKPAVQTAAPQAVKPDKASLATAPSTPASTDSAPPLAQTPKPTAPAAAQMLKPDGARIATAPPTPASTDSAVPPAQTPKSNATQTASASNESAEPSTPKIDSKKKPAEKIAQQKPAKSPKPPVKPIAQAERRSTEPAAPPKEAERSPQAAPGAGNPTALAPVPAPSVQQRVADGVTHAFGYLMHLPGALVPHLGGSDADAH